MASTQSTSKQIRQEFLDFFAAKQHTIVESSPVVPHDDPTLMFTNAGMNQFKDVFLGTGTRPYTRAADTQKCIRAGGKHNDLDDVGQDTYHHTFFEMLGNWSFGDYFKKEAIAWAWELLTEVWGIDKDRLHATYFEGDAAEGLEPDSESANLWRTLTDINPEHIHPGNKKDNFWEMGDTGPCGPCSEVHIDLTPDKSGARLVNADDPRVIEIWNLVFIQYNRGAEGKLTPLPAKHVDTGMGFERICAVLQGKTSNYDTDVWGPLINAIQKRTGAPDYWGTLPEEDYVSVTIEQQMIDVCYRVIADHVRCLTFALTDGAYPSNEGRGYVLRRILRRAVRYGRQYLKMHEPFLCDLVEPVVNQMSEAFPELRNSPAQGANNVRHVQSLLRDEEESFGKTLDRGIKLFNEAADYATKHHHGKISGEDAFKLHDTYGFPIDLTELMAEERGLTINVGEYERLMEEAREMARGKENVDDAAVAEAENAVVSDTEAAKNGPDHKQRMNTAKLTPTPAERNLDDPFEPETYRRLAGGVSCDDSLKYVSPFECSAFLWGLTRHSRLFDSDTAKKGQQVVFSTNRTTFYAEQGGQVSDTGTMETETRGSVVEVTRVVQRGNHVLHHGVVLAGEIESGLCRLRVDRGRRTKTTQNHTATHMLNWGLRKVLGTHVQQKGSLVDPEKTRFDFSHPKALTEEEVARVEELVNQRIKADQTVFTQEVDKDQALEIETLRAVFGETYPDRVRVVAIGAEIDDLLNDPKNPKWMEHPVEFCGGTHLSHTGEAECFALISEEAVAKGVRRVVGITGEDARQAEATGAELLRRAKALATEPRASARADEKRTPEPRGSARADSRGADELAGGASPRADSPSPSDADLSAQLSTLQKEVNEATIPLRIRAELRELITELQKTAKQQQKQAASVSSDAVMEQMASLLESAETVGGVTVVVGEVPAAHADALRGAIDWVRNKTTASAVLLLTAEDDKVTLVAGMSKDAVSRGLKAGDLIKEIAPLVGGRGGGRPDMAQGGGNNPAGIEDAVKQAHASLVQRLA